MFQGLGSENGTVVGGDIAWGSCPQGPLCLVFLEQRSPFQSDCLILQQHRSYPESPRKSAAWQECPLVSNTPSQDQCAWQKKGPAGLPPSCCLLALIPVSEQDPILLLSQYPPPQTHTPIFKPARTMRSFMLFNVEYYPGTWPEKDSNSFLTYTSP